MTYGIGGAAGKRDYSRDDEPAKPVRKSSRLAKKTEEVAGKKRGRTEEPEAARQPRRVGVQKGKGRTKASTVVKQALPQPLPQQELPEVKPGSTKKTKSKQTAAQEKRINRINEVEKKVLIAPPPQEPETNEPPNALAWLRSHIRWPTKGEAIRNATIGVVVAVGQFAINNTWNVPPTASLLLTTGTRAITAFTAAQSFIKK